MADTDVLTSNEAHGALPSGGGSVDVDKLALVNTAVSEMLDEMCGPIVQREVTKNVVSPSGTIWLDHPAAAGMVVTEYVSGTATVLTAEDFDTAGTYRLDTTNGALTRRSSWSDSSWHGHELVVTYTSGRYESTADVAAKFKMAAKIIVRHVWSLEQGFTPLEEIVPTGFGFSVPKRALDFLVGELRMPAIA